MVKEGAEPLLENSGTSSRSSSGLGWCRDKWIRLRDSLKEPTAPNLVAMSVFFGLFSGLIAFVYVGVLFKLLDWVWNTIPNTLVLPALEKAHAKWGWFPAPDNIAWVYIIFNGVLNGTLAGVVQRVIGFPGDLPDTIKNVHATATIPIKQAPAMFLCSTFTIIAGASLGPEAPILSICAAAVSWWSKNVFQHRGRMLKHCTLMGMASGLSALFGVGFGGTLFAFEVLHTSGIQFFESLTYGTSCSILCLATFRAMYGLQPFGPIWKFSATEAFDVADTRHIMLGIVLGVIGTGMGLLFMYLNTLTKYVYKKCGLIVAKRPELCGAVGGLLIAVVGIFLPPTLFWSEFEIETVADPSVPLPHVWPKGGFWGLAPFRQGNYSLGIWLALAFSKLFTINFTVVSGLRGGFIFPLMFAGACLGQAVAAIPNVPFLSDVHAALPAMAIAGAVTVVMTRTPFACALILTTLSGDAGVAAPTLTACLVAFYLTMNKPFFPVQKDRDDIEFKEVNWGNEEGDEVQENLSDDSAHIDDSARNPV